MEEIKKDPVAGEENKAAEEQARTTAAAAEIEKTQPIDLGQADTAAQPEAPAQEENASRQVNIPQSELERMAEPVSKKEKRQKKEAKKVVYVDDDDDDDDDDDYYYERPRSRGARAVKAIVITLLLLILFGAIGFAGYVVYHVYFYSQVYEGVWVDGVDYSGYTKREVLAMLTDKYSGVPAGSNLDITIGDKVYTLEIAGNISYDCRSTAEKIILYGRSGDFSTRVRDIVEALRFGYEIDMAYSITDSGIETQIQRIAADIEKPMEKATYIFDGQRVLMDKGQTGTSIDKNRLLTFVKNRLYTGDFSPAVFEMDITETNVLDLAAIKAEIEIPMREPELDIQRDPTGNTIIPGQIGIYFDVENAQNILDTSAERIVEAPVVFLYPTYTDAQFEALLFSHEFSRIDTPLTDNANRTTNVVLAASHCNNVILMPGETFSFNKEVGQRTAARGFKEATVYVGNSAEDGLGGGICQVSSAIYYCALRADLEINERYAHSRMVTYVPLGQDATVAWGAKDFKFTNNTEWPIKIVAVYDTTNHQVDVSIIGTNLETNRKIDIETVITSITPFQVEYQGEVGLLYGQKQIAGGYTGYKAETYRVEYLNGVEVSRTYITKSSYTKYNRVVQVPADDPRAGTVADVPNQPADPYEPVEPTPTITVTPPDTDVVTPNPRTGTVTPNPGSGTVTPDPNPGTGTVTPDPGSGTVTPDPNPGTGTASPSDIAA